MTIQVGLGLLLGLGGCAMRPPEAGTTVYVADIVNSVKCGLAEALQSEAGRRRLPGAIAEVELQLKVVDTRSNGVSSPSASAPVILGWYGPTALPTFSVSNQRSYTVDTTINLTYRLDAPNVSVCHAPGVNPNDKLGFARWLGDMIAGLSKVTRRGPRGRLDKLTYEATFAVTRARSAGASVRVVFIETGGNVGKSRADTQRLKIVISGPKGVASSYGAVPQRRGFSVRSSGGLPNLSGEQPAER